MTCPNCDHEDHEGERCEEFSEYVTGGIEPCACSWPDPYNYATVSEAS